jgi:nitrogen regulatory protein P-II 1
MTSRATPADSERGALARVQAIIREGQLEGVAERLLLIGVRGLTIGVAAGAGNAPRPTQVFRGGRYETPFVRQLVLEWVGPEGEADAVVRAIEQRARTGKVGDGRIFVERVEEAVRIRTGERGLDAV